MDFNFGNNNEPEKPEEENVNGFPFNLENDGADTDNSVADNSPDEWIPEEASDSDDGLEQNDLDGAPAEMAIVDEETLPEASEIVDEALEEVTNDVDDESSDNLLDDIPIQEDGNIQFDETSQGAIEDAVQMDEELETDNADEAGEEISDEAGEEVSEEAGEESFEEGEPLPEGDDSFNTEETPEVPAVPAALDKRVRTPDGEQEFLLSELIDVETGEPLDLASLIPAELLAGAASEVAGGFSLGGTQPTTSGFSMDASQPATGGFDMSAGSESSTPSKRRRPARPKTEKKKGGGILGVIMGGLLALILFPYVMAIIELTTGAQSNIPIPAPGIKSTYKYIPEWWPEWAMFVFPGRTVDVVATETGDKKDTDQPPEVPAVPDENATPAADEAPADDEIPADEEVPADDPAAVDDGAFDPDSFLANGDAADDNAQPADDNAEVPAEEPAADEPAEEAVEPGVVNAPQYTSAEVSEAVAKVGAAYKTAKEIDDTVYAALNDMAEKSTFVDTSVKDAQLKDAMSKVRTAMGKFGTQAKLYTALSEKWMARVDDATDNGGVMFVGTLSSVTERAGYQINTIAVEGQDSTVEVVGTRTIKPVAGDKVVVCGKRIADPANNLAGFTDNGLPVVWGGIIIKAENE